MSDVIGKCTETGPARVGWCVGRHLLRKAATLCGCLNDCVLKGFIIRPLASSDSTHTKDYFLTLH